MRISDWSSDVCSSDLASFRAGLRPVSVPHRSCAACHVIKQALQTRQANFGAILDPSIGGFQPNRPAQHFFVSQQAHRSEEHTSELQSLMRISYAVFCLKKKKTTTSTEITCR